MTSAQPATSRLKAMHVEYVLESTETSLVWGPDPVIRPTTTPMPRQTIPTTTTVRHSRNNSISPAFTTQTATHASGREQRGGAFFSGEGQGQRPSMKHCPGPSVALVQVGSDDDGGLR